MTFRVSFFYEVRLLRKGKVSLKRHPGHDPFKKVQIVVDRLLGRSSRVPGVTAKPRWFCIDGCGPDLISASLIQVRFANDILVLDFDLDDSDSLTLDSYGRLKSDVVKSMSKNLGVEIVDRYSVDAVVGSSSSYSLNQGDSILNSRIHLESHKEDVFLSHLIAREAALRVAVEKSIYNWGLYRTSGAIAKFWTPVVGSIVNKWKVELLIDRSDLLASFQSLRNSLNLPAVRGELRDLSRHWWSVLGFTVGSIVAGTSVAVATLAWLLPVR